MAEKLTPQQEQAVKDRGGKLLVSAAAGSGKTKVLVDRLMSYLTDPVNPADIDQFLIITYTKAAAMELRGKIAAKLSERIAEQPQNRHLQQQLQRLYMTTISTVHSFCGDILRQYAYRLDLSADFRVADENECRQLRDAVMQRILEEAYDNAGQDPDFCAFVDTQGVGRDDRQIPEILLKVYDSAWCHLNPKGWLESHLEAVDTDGIQDASQTLWGRYLMDKLFDYLDRQIEAMERCAKWAEGADGAEKQAVLLRDTVHQLQHLRDSQTWDEIVARKDIDYGTLRFGKKVTDEEMKAAVKAVRDACKAGVARLTRSFADPSRQVLADLEQSAPAVRGIVKLVQDFGKAYETAKRRRRILDFSDLEHLALDLLLGKKRSGPTSIAHEIGARYREVMVDEYQDSNEVQDAIYGALTEKTQACFMVGDVKQSIYQFRLADPGIFLDKYASFVPAEEADPMQGRKVILSRNFRSGGAVLEATNHVFRTCMSPEVGGLHYGPEESLYEGIPHVPLGEPEVELYAVAVREDSYKEEAAFTAQRIRELLDGSHMIRQKDALRPIRPEDITILLRSPNSTSMYYQQALERVGIRCETGGGRDLLRTEHVSVLRSILQTIHNPQLDIPLAAAMMSPVFGFTADDLAQIRSGNRAIPLVDALQKSNLPKVRCFLETLQALRRVARMEDLSQIMATVFVRTRIDSIYGAMEDGDARSADLQAIYQLAANQEPSGQRDLGRFLEHLDAMEEKGLSVAAEAAGAGAVSIMSIHKSKGLEFPVVFLCGLSRQFNQESKRAQVLCHKELGIGISAADSTRRVRYPTVAKRAISTKIGEDSLSEELRVLYVAMTRAKDRLIMTYTSHDIAKEIAEMAARMTMGCGSLLSREAVCPGEWVLQAALGRTEAGELFQLGGKPSETGLYDHPWLIRVAEAPQAQQGSGLEEQTQTMPADAVETIRQGLQFRYPYFDATTAPSKQTATQRKGRLKDQEAAENAQETERVTRTWRKPSFVDKTMQGKTYGTALHAVMQYIRYEACTNQDAVQREVMRLVEEGYITAEQGGIVDASPIAAFFATPLGQRLRQGKDVLREFKFSILDDGTAFAPGLQGEKILLQGVVDCALMEPDGITIVDFKTDKVTPDSVHAAAERYRPQVQAYAEAMSRIFERPVKRTCLYFFRLDQFVDM